MKLTFTLAVCPAYKNAFVPSIDKDGSGLPLATYPECMTEFEVQQTIAGNAKTMQVKGKRGKRGN